MRSGNARGKSRLDEGQGKAPAARARRDAAERERAGVGPREQEEKRTREKAKSTRVDQLGAVDDCLQRHGRGRPSLHRKVEQRVAAEVPLQCGWCRLRINGRVFSAHGRLAESADPGQQALVCRRRFPFCLFPFAFRREAAADGIEGAPQPSGSHGTDVDSRRISNVGVPHFPRCNEN